MSKTWGAKIVQTVKGQNIKFATEDTNEGTFWGIQSGLWCIRNYSVYYKNNEDELCDFAGYVGDYFDEKNNVEYSCEYKDGKILYVAKYTDTKDINNILMFDNSKIISYEYEFRNGETRNTARYIYNYREISSSEAYIDRSEYPEIDKNIGVIQTLLNNMQSLGFDLLDSKGKTIYSHAKDYTKITSLETSEKEILSDFVNPIAIDKTNKYTTLDYCQSDKGYKFTVEKYNNDLISGKSIKYTV